jgi:hypothetical protein
MTERRTRVVKASQTCGRLREPAFKKPAGEIPTPPSEDIPLWQALCLERELTPLVIGRRQMIEQQLARVRTHRSNIQRYRNLLQTSLTELERQFVEKRLAEEQLNLESLAASRSQ